MSRTEADNYVEFDGSLRSLAWLKKGDLPVELYHFLVDEYGSQGVSKLERIGKAA